MHASRIGHGVRRHFAPQSCCARRIGRGRATPMALILSGEGGHQAHAPLSTGQTLSIFHVLESRIRELQEHFSDIRRDLNQTDNSVSQLRAQLGASNGALQSLRESHINVSAMVDALRKDTGKLGVKANKLGAGLEHVVEDCRNTRDALKVTGTSVQMLKQEVGALTERVNDLQVHNETKTSNDVSELRDMIKQANASIRSVEEDSSRLTAVTTEVREQLRQTGHTVQGLGDRAAQANTVVGTLDLRLQEAFNHLKTTRQQLAETNLVALKTHEDHKHTKSLLNNVHDSVKTNALHIKQSKELLDGVNVRLGHAAEQVAKAFAVVAQSRERLDKVSSQVVSLGEAHQMVSDQTAQLRATVTETQITLQSVKVGLRETNAMVLPNLKLDFSSIMRPGSALSSVADVPSPGGSRRGNYSGRSRKASGKVLPNHGTASSALPFGTLDTWEPDLDSYTHGC